MTGRLLRISRTCTIGAGETDGTNAQRRRHHWNPKIFLFCRDKTPSRRLGDRIQFRARTKKMTEPERTTDSLIRDLRDDDIKIRHEAVRLLVDSGGAAVGPLVHAMQEDDNNDFRWYAATALVKIGEPSIGPLVTAMKHNQTKGFRKYAAAALGQIGKPAVQPLIKEFSTEDPELRGFIAEALCRIGEPAIEPLKELLHHDDAMLSRCASLSLWKMDEAGIRALVEDRPDDGGERDSKPGNT
jgi:HEAT repeat protein